MIPSAKPTPLPIVIITSSGIPDAQVNVLAIQLNCLGVVFENCRHVFPLVRVSVRGERGCSGLGVRTGKASVVNDTAMHVLPTPRSPTKTSFAFVSGGIRVLQRLNTTATGEEGSLSPTLFVRVTVTVTDSESPCTRSEGMASLK